MTQSPRCAVVAIGRDEGERLIRCFESISRNYPVVYVDSGSTDGSVEEATRRGIRVVNLSTDQGFTAARARNAGWRDLLAAYPELDYIQFVDGDCEFNPGWIEKGMAALDAEPALFAVFGRLHERFPERSLYNALCDDEWNVPVGLVNACGGIAMLRVAPLRDAGGYTDDLIAGEEPDLCLRVCQQPWVIRRIDADMAYHDAAMSQAGQWWRRMRRSGVAYAEHCARHGARAFPSWRSERNRIILWAFVFPLLILALFVGAWIRQSSLMALIGLVLCGIFPLQFVRLTVRKLRRGADLRFAAFHALWLVIGKFAQMGGIVRYWINRVRKSRNSLIEYKKG